MNGTQMRKRYRRRAFMRDTLEREIIRVRVDVAARPGHIDELQASLAKIPSARGFDNYRRPENNSHTFWQAVRKQGLITTVNKLWKKRRQSRKRRNKTVPYGIK